MNEPPDHATEGVLSENIADDAGTVVPAPHAGKHGWAAHEGHPLHQHNPVTGRVRWATDDEIARTESVYTFDAKQRDCPQCHREGGPAEGGCPHPWHQVSSGIPRLCLTGQGCVNHCGTGPCSMKCQVCLRIVSMAGNGPPCPACPDFRAHQEENRRVRESRCPDGGYCHGSSLAAGGSPCEPGQCLRVRTSGPLSGVFPGDRWPSEMVLRARGGNAEDDASQAGTPAPDLPDGRPLQEAICQNVELSRVLSVALGSRDGEETVKAHLGLGAQLASQIVSLLVQAHRNLTGENEIRYQGKTYTEDV